MPLFTNVKSANASPPFLAKARGQLKYVAVAIDYYNKQEEVKPLAKISKLTCDERYPMDLAFLPPTKFSVILELHPTLANFSW